MTKPLSHISLQLCTPAGDSRFTGDYVTGLMNTKTTLEHFGAQFNWAHFDNSSDLCHVRNKILGEFVRSEKYTHLLKVDSDIGFDASDVIRMLSFNKDFIAGVGCKKKFPMEWCASNRSDEDGSIIPVDMHYEGDTLLVEPKYVGAGFVLITKECAVKMMGAYKDLSYVDCYDKAMEYGLYDPVYITYENGTRERYFDDFAFCYRWRKIGGIVTVLPDIHLKHMGNYTFEGKWTESFKYGETSEIEPGQVGGREQAPCAAIAS